MTSISCNEYFLLLKFLNREWVALIFCMTLQYVKGALYSPLIWLPMTFNLFLTNVLYFFLLDIS